MSLESVLKKELDKKSRVPLNVDVYFWHAQNWSGTSESCQMFVKVRVRSLFYEYSKAGAWFRFWGMYENYVRFRHTEFGLEGAVVTRRKRSVAADNKLNVGVVHIILRA